MFAELKRLYFACAPGLPSLTNPNSTSNSNSNSAGASSVVASYGAAPASHAPTLTALSAALTPVPLPALSPAAVEARVALTVTKLRALEMLVLLLCGPLALRAQRLLLADAALVEALLGEAAAYLPDVVPYLAGQAAAMAEQPLEDPAEAEAQMRVAKAAAAEAAALAANSKDSVAINGGIVPMMKTAPGAKPGAGGENAREETVAVSVEDGRGWESEAAVYESRPGHAVEELAKVDYLITILTVLHRTFDGAHALGPARVHLGTLSFVSTVHFRVS